MKENKCKFDSLFKVSSSYLLIPIPSASGLIKVPIVLHLYSY